jgi:hypothetical protein
MSRVYASLPLSGPARALGRELLRGAELALERAGHASVELLALDSGGDAREERAADAARQAARIRRLLPTSVTSIRARSRRAARSPRPLLAGRGGPHDEPGLRPAGGGDGELVWDRAVPDG